MSAVILHLVQVAWSVPEATAWVIPQGHQLAGDSWRFNDHMYQGVAALDSDWAFLDDLEGIIRKRLWAQASQHYDGAGLKGGTDVVKYRALLKHSQGTPVIGHRLSETLLCCAIGGPWPRAGRMAEVK
eukprot:1494714-Pyramimonas_sp.AAC.1